VNRLFSKNFPPFLAQQAIIQHPSRFKAVDIGRRWGKTIGMNRKIYSAAHTSKGDYCWIAPTYDEAERGVDAAKKMVNPSFLSIKGSKPWVGYCSNGSRVFYRSADDPNPKGIRGHGFKGIVLDEAAQIHKDAIDYAIRPTLSDNMGWMMAVSTPKGRNWFYDLFTRGQDTEEKDYHSWTFPSNSSPYFPQPEWEEAKRTLPEDVFKQEYMAEFLEDSAGVFRRVDNIVSPVRCKCNNKGYAPGWSVGCDLAKHQDYTVLVAMCKECGDCHGFDRFNQIDWPVQKARIAAFSSRYPGRIKIDATGIGDPIYDDLRAFGLNLEPVKLTNQSKSQIIQDLIVSIEQQKISIPPDWEILKNELKRYEYEYTSGGTLKYNAPAGYHDDCVIALALANKGSSAQGIMMVI
jgi:phage FluMu gp28-like protein